MDFKIVDGDIMYPADLKDLVQLNEDLERVIDYYHGKFFNNDGYFFTLGCCTPKNYKSSSVNLRHTSTFQIHSRTFSVKPIDLEIFEKPKPQGWKPYEFIQLLDKVRIAEFKMLQINSKQGFVVDPKGKVAKEMLKIARKKDDYSSIATSKMSVLRRMFKRDPAEKEKMDRNKEFRDLGKHIQEKMDFCVEYLATQCGGWKPELEETDNDPMLKIVGDCITIQYKKWLFDFGISCKTDFNIFSCINFDEKMKTKRLMSFANVCGKESSKTYIDVIEQHTQMKYHDISIDQVTYDDVIGCLPANPNEPDPIIQKSLFDVFAGNLMQFVFTYYCMHAARVMDMEVYFETSLSQVTPIATTTSDVIMGIDVTKQPIDLIIVNGAKIELYELKCGDDVSRFQMTSIQALQSHATYDVVNVLDVVSGVPLKRDCLLNDVLWQMSEMEFLRKIKSFFREIRQLTPKPHIEMLKGEAFTLFKCPVDFENARDMIELINLKTLEIPLTKLSLSCEDATKLDDLAEKFIKNIPKKICRVEQNVKLSNFRTGKNEFMFTSPKVKGDEGHPITAFQFCFNNKFHQAFKRVLGDDFFSLKGHVEQREMRVLRQYTVQYPTSIDGKSYETTDCSFSAGKGLCSLNLRSRIRRMIVNDPKKDSSNPLLSLLNLSIFNEDRNNSLINDFGVADHYIPPDRFNANEETMERVRQWALERISLMNHPLTGKYVGVSNEEIFGGDGTMFGLDDMELKDAGFFTKFKKDVEKMNLSIMECPAMKNTFQMIQKCVTLSKYYNELKPRGLLTAYKFFKVGSINTMMFVDLKGNIRLNEIGFFSSWRSALHSILGLGQHKFMSGNWLSKNVYFCRKMSERLEKISKMDFAQMYCFNIQFPDFSWSRSLTEQFHEVIRSHSLEDFSILVDLGSTITCIEHIGKFVKGLIKQACVYIQMASGGLEIVSDNEKNLFNLACGLLDLQNSSPNPNFAMNYNNMATVLNCIKNNKLSTFKGNYDRFTDLLLIVCLKESLFHFIKSGEKGAEALYRDPIYKEYLTMIGVPYVESMTNMDSLLQTRSIGPCLAGVVMINPEIVDTSRARSIFQDDDLISVEALDESTAPFQNMDPIWHASKCFVGNAMNPTAQWYAKFIKENFGLELPMKYFCDWKIQPALLPDIGFPQKLASCKFASQAIDIVRESKLEVGNKRNLLTYLVPGEENVFAVDNLIGHHYEKFNLEYNDKMNTPLNPVVLYCLSAYMKAQDAGGIDPKGKIINSSKLYYYNSVPPDLKPVIADSFLRRMSSKNLDKTNMSSSSLYKSEKMSKAEAVRRLTNEVCGLLGVQSFNTEDFAKWLAQKFEKSLNGIGPRFPTEVMATTKIGDPTKPRSISIEEITCLYMNHLLNECISKVKYNSLFDSAKGAGMLSQATKVLNNIINEAKMDIYSANALYKELPKDRSKWENHTMRVSQRIVCAFLNFDAKSFGPFWSILVTFLEVMNMNFQIGELEEYILKAGMFTLCNQFMVFDPTILEMYMKQVYIEYLRTDKSTLPEDLKDCKFMVKSSDGTTYHQLIKEKLKIECAQIAKNFVSKKDFKFSNILQAYRKLISHGLCFLPDVQKFGIYRLGGCSQGNLAVQQASSVADKLNHAHISYTNKLKEFVEVATDFVQKQSMDGKMIMLEGIRSENKGIWTQNYGKTNSPHTYKIKGYTWFYSYSDSVQKLVGCSIADFFELPMLFQIALFGFLPIISDSRFINNSKQATGIITKETKEKYNDFLSYYESTIALMSSGDDVAAIVLFPNMLMASVYNLHMTEYYRLTGSEINPAKTGPGGDLRFMNIAGNFQKVPHSKKTHFVVKPNEGKILAVCAFPRCADPFTNGISLKMAGMTLMRGGTSSKTVQHLMYFGHLINNSLIGLNLPELCMNYDFEIDKFPPFLSKPCFFMLPLASVELTTDWSLWYDARFKQIMSKVESDNIISAEDAFLLHHKVNGPYSLTGNRTSGPNKPCSILQITTKPIHRDISKLSEHEYHSRVYTIDGVPKTTQGLGSLNDKTALLTVTERYITGERYILDPITPTFSHFSGLMSKRSDSKFTHPMHTKGAIYYANHVKIMNAREYILFFTQRLNLPGWKFDGTIPNSNSTCAFPTFPSPVQCEWLSPDNDPYMKDMKNVMSACLSIPNLESGDMRVIPIDSSEPFMRDVPFTNGLSADQMEAIVHSESYEKNFACVEMDTLMSILETIGYNTHSNAWNNIKDILQDRKTMREMAYIAEARRSVICDSYVMAIFFATVHRYESFILLPKDFDLSRIDQRQGDVPSVLVSFLSYALIFFQNVYDFTNAYKNTMVGVCNARLPYDLESVIKMFGKRCSQMTNHIWKFDMLLSLIGMKTMMKYQLLPQHEPLPINLHRIVGNTHYIFWSGTSQGEPTYYVFKFKKNVLKMIVSAIELVPVGKESKNQAVQIYTFHNNISKILSCDRVTKGLTFFYDNMLVGDVFSESVGSKPMGQINANVNVDISYGDWEESQKNNDFVHKRDMYHQEIRKNFSMPKLVQTLEKRDFKKIIDWFVSYEFKNEVGRCVSIYDGFALMDDGNTEIFMQDETVSIDIGDVGVYFNDSELPLSFLMGRIPTRQPKFHVSVTLQPDQPLRLMPPLRELQILSAEYLNLRDIIQSNSDMVLDEESTKQINEFKEKAVTIKREVGKMLSLNKNRLPRRLRARQEALQKIFNPGIDDVSTYKYIRKDTKTPVVLEMTKNKKEADTLGVPNLNFLIANRSGKMFLSYQELGDALKEKTDSFVEFGFTD